jgi:NAD(P)-dependent dehydrogenase (short-subunit alcohol dehydrogenase family)
MNPRIGARDWLNCRVWLIGASAGIGEALAMALAARGARIALSARSAGALQALAARLGQPALILPVDVTQPEAVQGAWETLLSRWGGVDLVVYMAGTYAPLDAKAPAESVLPVARQTVAVNFLGALEVASQVAPWLAAQPADGRPRGIVLVASVAGYRGLPRALAYSASKAALIAYAESLYLDLAPAGVGVWVVNPGFVRTRLTAQNEFRMPALIEVREAVEEIVDGLAGGGFEIHFPRRFSQLMKLMALLPARPYFALMRRVAGSR